jgi:hypothetical protein
MDSDSPQLPHVALEPEQPQSSETFTPVTPSSDLTEPVIIHPLAGTGITEETPSIQPNLAISPLQNLTNNAQSPKHPIHNYETANGGVIASDHSKSHRFLPSFLKHMPRKTLLILGSASTLLILCLVVVGVIFYQNSKAGNLLKLAKADIAKGQYSLASSLLDKASKYYALSSNRKDILSLTSQDKTWITDASYLQQASTYVQKQNFSSATTLLNKISSAFPGYDAVTTQKKLITSDQAAIAAAAQAAATKAAVAAEAASAAAQAAAAAAAAAAEAKAAAQTKTSSSSVSKTNVTPPIISASSPTYSSIPVNVSGGFDYYYVGSYQYANGTGASMVTTQEAPVVPEPAGQNNHSLIELSVQSANAQQIIEVGWIVDSAQYGDSSPHLFVYHWINGSPTCYSEASDECGFVQVSGTNSPSEALAVGASATYEINYSGGNWNIYYNGDEVGYFPGSLWSGTYTQMGFTQAFGEVAENPANTAGCIQMGNGIAGSSADSARISSFGLLGSSSAPSLKFQVTSPSSYSIGSTSSNGFSLGGPGTC